MPEEIPQAQFNGWAKVEVMGHQSHVGYVRTEVYGAAVLFRVDTPELPEREYELKEPGVVGRHWASAGTKVKRSASPGVSVLVGAGSIYRIIPCTQEAAMRAIEALIRSELMEITLPASKLEIEAGDDSDDEDFIDEDGGTDEGEQEARFFSPSS